MKSFSEIRRNINTFLSKPIAEIGGKEVTRWDATYLVGALAAAATLSLNPDIRQAVIDSNIPVGTPFVEIDRNQDNGQAPQGNGLEAPGVYTGVRTDNPNGLYTAAVDVVAVPVPNQLIG